MRASALSLTELNVANNDLGSMPAVMAALCECLLQLEVLKTLDLSKNALGGTEGACKLVVVLPCCLPS